MKREVMFVCERCSTGYACEPDALDCERACSLAELLISEGFVSMGEAVSELNTIDTNRLVCLLDSFKI